MIFVLAAVCLLCLVLFGVQGFALAGLACLGTWLWWRSGQQEQEIQALEDAWIRSQGDDR